MNCLFKGLLIAIMNLFGSEGNYTNLLWDSYKYLSQLNNVNFSDDILWRETVDNVNICGFKCFKDTSCQSFEFNVNSKTCQSHRGCFLTQAANNFTTTSASKYYVLDDGQCSRRFSEEKMIWKTCKPSLDLLESIGQPVTGRRVIVEGILGTLGWFRVCFCSDTDNCGFSLTFRIKRYGSHVAIHKLVNGNFKNGKILIETSKFPIAVESLFCLEIIVTSGTYQVEVNNKFLLEHNATEDIGTNNLLQILNVQEFILYEVSVVED